MSKLAVLACAIVILFAPSIALASPTGPVPYTYFGATEARGAPPAPFVGHTGTLGKMPETRWVYIQRVDRATFDWSWIDTQRTTMTQLGLTHFQYLVSNVPGWAVAGHTSTCSTNGTTTIVLASALPLLQVGDNAFVNKISYGPVVSVSGTTVVLTTAVPGTASGVAFEGGHGTINSITGKWESYSPPDDYADMTNFLNGLLTRYPEIDQINVQNEPAGNNPIPADAAAIDRVVIDYVHANFPGVRVGSAAVLLQRAGGWLDTFWSGGGPKDFDILLYHGYPGFSRTTPSGNTVELGIQRGVLTKQIFAKYGLQNLPTEDEESSWGTDTTATANGTDMTAFVSQALLMHWSVGDSTLVWYTHSGTGWGTLASGNVINPAGTSWITTETWMLGATLLAPGIGITNGVLSGVDPYYSSGVRSGVWTRPGGYSAISVWNVAENTSAVYDVPAHTPPYTQYRDYTNTVTPIPVSQQVTITNKPIWIETGNPPPPSGSCL